MIHVTNRKDSNMEAEINAHVLSREYLSRLSKLGNTIQLSATSLDESKVKNPQ